LEEGEGDLPAERVGIVVGIQVGCMMRLTASSAQFGDNRVQETDRLEEDRLLSEDQDCSPRV
jgi:hypothetical protein